MTKPVDPKRVAHAVELKREGRTNREVGEAIGVSKDSVTRILQRAVREGVVTSAELALPANDSKAEAAARTLDDLLGLDAPSPPPEPALPPVASPPPAPIRPPQTGDTRCFHCGARVQLSRRYRRGPVRVELVANRALRYGYARARLGRQLASVYVQHDPARPTLPPAPTTEHVRLRVGGWHLQAYFSKAVG